MNVEFDQREEIVSGCHDLNPRLGRQLFEHYVGRKVHQSRGGRVGI
jgi:hypothetical protein